MSSEENIERSECMVSVDSDIPCDVTPDGRIIIQTLGGSITIALHKGIDKRRYRLKPIERKSVSNTPLATFWFAGHQSQDDVKGQRNEELEDEGQRDEDEEDLDSEDLADQVEDTSKNSPSLTVCTADAKTTKQSWPETPRSDMELANFCQKLAAQSLKLWKEKSSLKKKNLQQLLANPETLFGFGDFSGAQWSYQAIGNQLKGSEEVQIPFHKLRLAKWWESNLKSLGATKHRTLSAMYNHLVPDFKSLKITERSSHKKRIKRYVQEGEILFLLATRCPGLILTVSMKNSVYEALWKYKDYPCVTNLSWIDKELIQQSDIYSHSVVRIELQQQAN
ncbi:hypothetical protein IQ07DRAFT_183104 [Pyrenochaeta sp. DS3sAY3a]|nr:hypothetical protein IQ07DRAFT_183104 [Pyrenochaeta sp. DS3sAY3a]